MPSFTVALEPHRRFAIFDARLTLTDAARHAFESVNLRIETLPVRALIDTGANVTCMRVGTAKKLGILSAVGFDPINSASDTKIALKYPVKLLLPGDGEKELVVPELPIPGQGYDVLIGTNVLCEGVLTYDGPAKTCTFRW